MSERARSERPFYLRLDGKIVFTVARVAYGFIFIWASWEKLLHPQEFAVVTHNYQLIPNALVGLVAIVLPWLEMVCGLLLVVGRLARGSLLLLNGLMVVFIGAIAINIVRGLDIHCGCFSLSQEGEKLAFITLLRDIGIWLLGMGLLAWKILKDLAPASRIPSGRALGPQPRSSR